MASNLALASVLHAGAGVPLVPPLSGNSYSLCPMPMTSHKAHMAHISLAFYSSISQRPIMYRLYLYTYNIHRIYVFIYIFTRQPTCSDTHTYILPGGARPPPSLTQPQQKVLGLAGSGEVLCFLLQNQNKTKRPYSPSVSFHTP